ncbi:hypothetical protein [Streptomyces mirabilis]
MAVAAGAVAQLTSPATAMTVMAIASVAATLLISGLRQRPEVSTPQQKQPEVNAP